MLPKGGRGQAAQQFSAIDPELLPLVESVFQKYPALARHRADFAVITGKPMGPHTGQLESYPPEELYNPIPGKATTELYNRDVPPEAQSQLIAGDMLHRMGAVDFETGQPVDPEYRAMKSQLLATMTPQQDKMNHAAFDRNKARSDPRTFDQFRTSPTPQGDLRTFDQFMDTSLGDEFIMGALTPDHGDYWRGRPGTHQRSVYTPQQDALLNQMRQYLSGGSALLPTGKR